MSVKKDVIIIGGGITGTSIALRLAEQGAGRILLLEKSYLGAGSTGKSGAILRQHYSHETTIRMARESLGFFRDFEAESGRDIGFRQVGMALISPESGREGLEKNVKLQQSLGVDTRLVEQSELQELLPEARFDGGKFIGAWEPEAAYVNPVKTVNAFAHVAAEKGVEFRFGETVSDILIEGEHVRGVKTSQGTTIEAPVVINAGGPWARRLLERVGLNYPLNAVRPQQAYFEPPTQASGRVIFLDVALGMYWKPEDAGWTRVGNMDFDADEAVTDPDQYDEGVSHYFIDSVRTRISERLPDYKRAVSWGGTGALYTTTPDAHPIIGEVPSISGFYVAAGFSGHGFKLGPAVAQGVAAMVTGSGDSPYAHDYFLAERFEKEKAVSGSYAYGILG